MQWPRSQPLHHIQRGEAKRPETRHHHHVNVLEGANPTEIITNMEEDMARELTMPGAVHWEFTGQQEEQAKEMAFLSKALLIALFLIFLIIVSQFNSVTTPFIIGFSVVFSLAALLLGLVIFQMEFVIIMTMIGIISLAGVVVNNAIVLIDYTNLLRSRREGAWLGGRRVREAATKLPFEEVNNAIVQGGKTRLRPVLLTAITTVLGLLPLAIGLNIDFVGLGDQLRSQHLCGWRQQRLLEADELGHHFWLDVCHVLDPHHRARHVLVDRAHDVQVGDMGRTV